MLVHEVTRAEELAKWRRAHSVDHAGLEEHRAWCVLATRGLVVKQFDAVELRVVVADVLAVAADAVHVQYLARRRSLEAESTWQRKGGEERSNVRNSEWEFGTGNRKRRWYARDYPEQENKVILPLLPHEPWRRAKNAGCGRVQ